MQIFKVSFLFRLHFLNLYFLREDLKHTLHFPHFEPAQTEVRDRFSWRSKEGRSRAVLCSFRSRGSRLNLQNHCLQEPWLGNMKHIRPSRWWVPGPHLGQRLAPAGCQMYGGGHSGGSNGCEGQTSALGACVGTRSSCCLYPVGGCYVKKIIAIWRQSPTSQPFPQQRSSQETMPDCVPHRGGQLAARLLLACQNESQRQGSWLVRAPGHMWEETLKNIKQTKRRFRAFVARV